MAAVVESKTKVGVFGDLKVITIQTSAAAATGDTIDFGSDASDARGVRLTEILTYIANDDAGASVQATFVPATGILTLGTISTGIHNITVIGY
jgi:hypothetical protein